MRRTTLLAAFSAATLLTGMSFAHAGNGPKGEGSNPCDDDFTLTWTPASVFPPNHKETAGSLVYTAPDGNTTDTLQLKIVGITSDEVLPDGEEMNGSGNTLIDAGWDATEADGTGEVSRNFWIRAERSGQGDGRTYSIEYTAKADPGAPAGLGLSNDCSGTATVFVPHDMGGGNDS